MYWISSAPVSRGYCLMRYSNGAPLKGPFYNDEVQQRGSGERARWLSAVLIVTSIGATSVVVRVWPVKTAAPILASRRLPLYATPVLAQPALLVTAIRTPPHRRVTTLIAAPEPAATVPPVSGVELEPAAPQLAATGGVLEPALTDPPAPSDRPVETVVAQPTDAAPVI